MFDIIKLFFICQCLFAFTQAIAQEVTLEEVSRKPVPLKNDTAKVAEEPSPEKSVLEVSKQDESAKEVLLINRIDNGVIKGCNRGQTCVYDRVHKSADELDLAVKLAMDGQYDLGEYTDAYLREFVTQRPYGDEVRLSLIHI